MDVLNHKDRGATISNGQMNLWHLRFALRQPIMVFRVGAAAEVDVGEVAGISKVTLQRLPLAAMEGFFLMMVSATTAFNHFKSSYLDS